MNGRQAKKLRRAYLNGVLQGETRTWRRFKMDYIRGLTLMDGDDAMIRRLNDQQKTFLKCNSYGL